MDTVQWPQEIVVKPMEEIVPNTCPKPSSSLERKVRPQKEQAVNCPRCNSTNTKFCYYNNYSLSQPRYFCKTCRRYWTEGGSLRNIPVGGGSRKNKRSSSSSSSLSSTSSANISLKKLPDLVPPTTCSQSSSHQNPKIHEAQDLNLSFPSTHDFKTISELIQVPNFDNNNNNKNHNMPCSSSSTSSHHLSALELLTGITTSRGFTSFMPMPGSDPNTIYSSGGFSLQEFKPTLNFSVLDGLGSSSATTTTNGYGNLQETSTGKLLFPFEDLKPVSSTNGIEQNNREQADSNGYWNGIFSGGSW